MSSNSSGSGIFSGTQTSVQNAQDQSAETFATSLLAGLIWGSINLLLFLVLKDRIPKLYQPKSFLVSARQRVKPIAPGLWRWIKPLFNRNDDEFLRKSGLDGYFLCRYLIALLMIFGPATLLFIPILIPINYTGGTSDAITGTEKLTVSHLDPDHYDRLWAHCLLALALTVWTCYIMFRELRNFIRVRQAYLTAPQHRIRASASTVLIETLPFKFADQDALANLFDVYPGGIRNIWVNRNYKELLELIKQRKKIAEKLENAETALIRKCWAAAQKQAKSRETRGTEPIQQASSGGFSVNNPGQVHHTVDEAVEAASRSQENLSETRVGGNVFGRGVGTVTKGIRGIGHGIENLGNAGLGRVLSKRISNKRADGELLVKDANLEKTTSQSDQNEESHASREARIRQALDHAEPPFNPEFDNDQRLETVWSKYIGVKDRDTMRIVEEWKWCPGFMNPKARKVDTIYHCRRELARFNRMIEERQLPDVTSIFPPMNSAFIQFNNQAAAHMACQSLAHQLPNFMTPRHVEMAPNDVLWKNMSIPWWQRYIRKSLVFVVSLVLVVLFIPLIAASSALSQFDVLRKSKPFLFAEHWPTAVVNLIQALLPVILVNLWIFLLGVLLRLVIKRNGSPTKMQAESSVQKYFFAFTFIQYFLVVTLASAFSDLASTIVILVDQGKFDFTDIPNLLAKYLPKASGYFLSNILIQSFGQSMTGLFQLLPLITLGFKLLFNKSARAKYKTRTNLENINFGTTYPMYTVLACIALIYAVIAPMILPFTLIGFGLWWISTRYQMLYIFRYTIDNGGLFFPTAIKQLFAGLYTMEIFLTGYIIVVTTTDATTGGNNPNISKGPLYPLYVIMVIAIVITITFQVLLTKSFNPLLLYLPITLEDDAVARDEEFERLLATRHAPEDETRMMNHAAHGLEDHDNEADSEKSQLESKRRSSLLPRTEPDAAQELDPENPSNPTDPFPQEELDNRKTRPRGLHALNPKRLLNSEVPRKSWVERGRRSPMYSPHGSSNQTPTLSRPEVSNAAGAEFDTVEQETQMLDHTEPEEGKSASLSDPLQSPKRTFSKRSLTRAKTQTGENGEPLDRPITSETGNARGLQSAIHKVVAAPVNYIAPGQERIDAQTNRLIEEARQLYSDIPDDLEDLSIEGRDVLVSQAYRHQALRAKRPCIWIPRDPYGISDAEIRNMGKFSEWIWASNERQVLLPNGKPMYEGPPPDFDQVDLIQL